MRTPQNHFNAGVRFKAIAFSEASRKDVTLTPQDVAELCEEFAAKIRAHIAREAAVKE